MPMGIDEVSPMKGPTQRMRTGEDLREPQLTATTSTSTSGSNDFNGFAGEYWSHSMLSMMASGEKPSQPLDPIVQPPLSDLHQTRKPDAQSRQEQMMTCRGHPRLRWPVLLVGLPDTQHQNRI